MRIRDKILSDCFAWPWASVANPYLLLFGVGRLDSRPPGRCRAGLLLSGWMKVGRNRVVLFLSMIIVTKQSKYLIYVHNLIFTTALCSWYY